MVRKVSHTVGGPGCTQPSAARRRRPGGGNGSPRAARTARSAPGRASAISGRPSAGAQVARRVACDGDPGRTQHSNGHSPVNRGALLEERGDPLGPVGSGGQQQVEVGLEAQAVGQRDVEPTLHCIA